MRVVYLCNGKQCEKNVYAYCALRGQGECSHTENVEFAKNRFCGDPWNYPERFEKHEVNGEDRYWEKEE